MEWENNPEGSSEAILGLTLQGGAKIESLSRERASLETIFHALTTKPGAAYRSEPDPKPKAAAPPSLKPKKSQPSPSLTRRIASALSTWPRVAKAFLKRDFLEEWSYQLAFSLEFLGLFFSLTMYYFLSKLFAQTVNPYLSP